MQLAKLVRSIWFESWKKKVYTKNLFADFTYRLVLPCKLWKLRGSQRCEARNRRLWISFRLQWVDFVVKTYPSRAFSCWQVCDCFVLKIYKLKKTFFFQFKTKQFRSISTRLKSCHCRRQKCSPWSFSRPTTRECSQRRRFVCPTVRERKGKSSLDCPSKKWISSKSSQKRSSACCFGPRKVGESEGLCSWIAA